MTSLFGFRRLFCDPLVLGAAALGLYLLAGCGAIYPEIKTPMKPAPAGQELEPPPPANVLYIALAEVQIPSRTRDGRKWDDTGDGQPDPYAKLFLNGEQLFVTPTQSDTFNPTWPDAPKQNYQVGKDAVLLVELWDDNPLHSQPICVKEFDDLHEAASERGALTALCDGGARIEVEVKPAQAQFGLGFSYELRSEEVVVTDVLALSPASRGGMRVDDRILQVMSRPVKPMKSAELRSLINSNAPQGVQLLIRSGTQEKQLTLKEGPIYLKGEK